METAVLFLIFLAAFVGLILYRLWLTKQSYKEREDGRIMRLVPGDGHKLYELDCATLEMSEVEATQKGDVCEYATKDGCLYVTALNEKNAIKRFSRMVPGKFEKVK